MQQSKLKEEKIYNIAVACVAFSDHTRTQHLKWLQLKCATKFLNLVGYI